MVKIVLDAGHGGHDSGATGNGLKEKDLTLKIVQYMRDILNNEYEGATVKLTRDGDSYLTLSERSRIANDWGADFFLSVHINSFGDSSANGYETYIYNGSVSNRTIAIQNVMHPVINKRAGLQDRGKKRANFAVLRLSNMSALLTEIGFISNGNDASKLKHDSYLKEVARGHIDGLIQALGGITRKTPSKTEQPKPELWKIQVGAFSSKENAEHFLKDVQKIYRDAFLTQ